MFIGAIFPIPKYMADLWHGFRHMSIIPIIDEYIILGIGNPIDN